MRAQKELLLLPMPLFADFRVAAHAEDGAPAWLPEELRVPPDALNIGLFSLYSSLLKSSLAVAGVLG